MDRLVAQLVAREYLLLKLLGLGVFWGYLFLAQHLFASYVVVPLLLLSPRLRRYRPQLLLAGFVFDVELTSQIITPFYIFPFRELFSLRNPSFQGSYFPWLVVANLLALGALLLVALGTARIRSVRTYLVIPWYLALSVMSYLGYHAHITGASVPSLLAAATIAVFMKKLWLTYLLALELKVSAVASWPRWLEGLALPGPNFREHFSLPAADPTAETAHFWRGVILSALFAVLIVVFCELTYTRYPLIGPANYGQLLTCTYPSLSVDPRYLEVVPRHLLLACFFQIEIVYGILKHIFLDGAALVIPALFVGVRLPWPYGNVFTARDWNTFLSRLFVYYSMIVYRVFILEAYKLLRAVFGAQAKGRAITATATGLGVFCGGFLYHANKDFIANYFYSRSSILELIFSAGPLVYFSFLALSCALVALLPPAHRRLHRGLLPLLFVLLLVGRSFYGTYRFKVDPQLKLDNLLYILRGKAP